MIILIVIIFLGWLIKSGSRECTSNAHCGSESYCGSDFACHKIPVIEKITTPVQRNYTGFGIALGIAIIIAALIMNWHNIRWPKKKEQPKEEQKELVEGDYSQQQIYTNYPTPEENIKNKGKKVNEKPQKGFEELLPPKPPKKVFNNYLSYVLAGLTALSLLLVIGAKYWYFGIIIGILAFFFIWKLFNYCVEYKLEKVLIIILSLIFIFSSIILMIKEIFAIGSALMIIALFVLIRSYQ